MIVFSIIQDGFEYTVELKGGKTQDAKKAALKQIKGTILNMLRLRKTTGQTLGLNLSKPIGFSFKLGAKTINTLTIAEKLNVTVKVGNSNKKIKKFFTITENLIDFALRGNKAYTDKEISTMMGELESIMADEKAVRTSKVLANEAIVTAN